MKVKTKKKGISIDTNIDEIFSKTVTKFGNGAKIDAPKRLKGKKVLILVLKD